uniref:Uncharacterized protein n=1 Tax=Panagrolaimus sp. PS1159 TaxID=55785 RepID=A0AC35GND4_9BILA
MKPKNSKVSAKPTAASKSVKKAKASAKPVTTPKTAKRAKASPSAAKKPVTPKTVKKPAALKTSKNAKGDDATLFKRQITALAKPATERNALVEIITMFMEERKGSNLPDHIVKSLITAIQKQLKNANPTMISDTISALSYVAGVKKYIPIIIKNSVLKLLVPFLNRTEEEIIVPTMEVFGNVAENDDDAGVAAVFKTGLLKHLRNAFALNDDDISCKAIWLLRKLCATSGPQDQLYNEIFDEGLIYNIVNHLDAPSHTARIDALHAFSNLTSFADEKRILGIVDAGAISDLCNFFGFDNSILTLMTLNCLNDLISKCGSRVKEVTDQIQGCGGYDIISDMQEDEDDFIRETCVDLLDFFQ